MTQSTTQATLSEHYKAIRARLGDRRTPARPIIPRDRIRPDEPAPIKSDQPNELETIMAIELDQPKRIEHEPPKAGARKYVHILHDMAVKYNLSQIELIGRNRDQRIMKARQEAYYLMQRAGYSLPQIGQFLGGRDHTTVLSGIRRHEKRLKGQVK
jgi:hypothetical protein